MEENGNGHKRPFGPHGEGCDCEPTGMPPKPDDAAETVRAPADRPQRPEIPPMRVVVGYDPNNLNELIFHAVSDAIATHFLAGVDTCDFDGDALNGRQLAHLLGGLMRGFALAKESAQIIQMNYAQLMMEGMIAERRRLEEEAVAEPEPEEKQDGMAELHDIGKLFEKKPPPDAA